MATLPPALDQTASTAASLAEVAWETLTGPELVEAAAVLAGARARVEAALVVVAGRLACRDTPDAADALGAAGWADAKDFLTHLVGGRKGAGAGLVRTATRTQAMPDVLAAMTTGAVSTAQARVIGERVATLPHEPALRETVTAWMLELATTGGLDATDLDHAFPGLVAEIDPDGAARGLEADRAQAERAAHHARHLTFTPDTLGGVRIRGYATVEDAETVKATLFPLAAPQTTAPGACGGVARVPGRPLRRPGDPVRRRCPDPACRHDGADAREPGARLWDALVEGCRRLQAGDQLPRAHGTTARLTVTIDHQQLRDGLVDHDGRAGHGVLDDGTHLSVAAVRRLACDAEVLPAVLGSRGEVLDVGRLSRLVTTSIWLALVLRDRHCTFPGCRRPPTACEAHHLTHWADGGPTSLDNLALLCRRHHTITHTTPWTIHLDPATRRPTWTPPPPVDDTGRFTYHPATHPPPPRRPPPGQPPPERVA
ncbi:HNH endonuclease signature motif containing protein [Nocardioides litoris]|uniref:HNH endonuclease signature motif containing protein n=1 Tax=Nocardioides litoris TaxID=1926648 RepID=UPI001B86ED53|nr:HNH endonuclease signature motif containing protein [Nocardioides litoris]